MNRALWKKAIGEAWILLTGCALLMFGFHWLFVYITSLIGQQDFRAILDLTAGTENEEAAKALVKAWASLGKWYS